MDNKYSLLIADDDEITREGIRKYLLRQFPCIESVWTAKDGLEAYELFEQEHPDIVFTDIAMPRCDGLELIQTLHQNGYSPKVVIISAHENFSYAQNAVRLGVGDYLIKPILPAQIKQITQKLLDEIIQHDTFLNNINEMMNKYQKNLPILRERFFHSILHEELSEERILEKARLVDLDLTGKSYTVAVLKVRAHAQEYQSEAEQFANFFPAVIDTVFPPEIRVYHRMLGSSDEVLILVSDDPDTNRLFRAANASLNKFLASAKKYTGLLVSGALGRQYSSAEGIRSSYREAVNTLLSDVGQPADSIRNYEDISPNLDQEFRMDSELEKNLLQSVKYQSYNHCLELIDRMAEQAASFDNVKFEYIKTYFLKLTVLILRELQVTYAEKADLPVHFDGLFATKDMENCLSWFKLFICNVVSRYQKLNQEKGHSLVNRAKHIISDHIADSSFNIDDVASVLYISSNYLRQIFRQQSGESFVEYLTRIRMEKALKLLQDPAAKLKIQEIAEQTGFNNQRYFSVCFKKYYGKTPTEVRGN